MNFSFIGFVFLICRLISKDSLNTFLLSQSHYFSLIMLNPKKSKDKYNYN